MQVCGAGGVCPAVCGVCVCSRLRGAHLVGGADVSHETPPGRHHGNEEAEGRLALRGQGSRVCVLSTSAPEQNGELSVCVSFSDE